MFVIAHRGANKFAPQNTLEAFKKAAEQGSDGVETDIRITRDGKLVLCHNTTVNKTSNGRGKIAKLYYKDLADFDFGSWFGSKFQHTFIPTLEDFLQTMSGTNISILDIELKPVSHRDISFVAEVLYDVEKYGLSDKLLISSFDESILKKVKALNENIKVGLLYPSIGDIAKNKIKAPINRAVKYGYDFLLPQHAYVSEGMIRKAHKANVKVAPWTVNDISLIDKLYAWEADGVITDYPDIMKNKIESI